MSNGQEEICRKPYWGCHDGCYKCSVQSVPCRVPILLGPIFQRGFGSAANSNRPSDCTAEADGR